MFLTALLTVLSDDGFQLPSPQAAEARKQALLLNDWCKKPEKQHILQHFAENLIAKLSAPFKRIVFKQGQSAARFVTQRGRIWGRYHQLRTSIEFRTLWSDFIKLSTQCVATPILYQFLTDVVFEQLVKQHFPVDDKEEASGGTLLSLQEENVVKYAAGYVCRTIRKRLERSSNPQKEELILSLTELLDDDHEISDTTEWIDLVDRGGLCHIKDSTFMVFHALEEGVRKHFNKSAARGLIVGAKEKVTTSLLTDEDVQFYWSIASADFEEAAAKTLLKMIVDLWITIRGFSFSSAWIEQYKQANKKTIQRSKALRRELFTDDVNNS